MKDTVPLQQFTSINQRSLIILINMFFGKVTKDFKRLLFQRSELKKKCAVRSLIE